MLVNLKLWLCLSGHKFNHTFHIGNINVETVQSFTYLGVKFTSSGTFSLAQKELSLKAMKACFNLKKAWLPSFMTPRLGLKLFDQLIFPILSYGSEIWSVPVNFLELCFVKSLEKYRGKEIHISF